MSDAQEYYDWKQEVDDALCMLHERICCLEKKVKLLEGKNTRTDREGKVLEKT